MTTAAQYLSPAGRNWPEIKEWLGLIQVRVAKFAEIGKERDE
jgi:hypothetical protein